MSTFNIYQKLEYAVILADSLGHKKIETGNITPLLAPKIVHVAPCVYAAHAGTWQPALKMLHALHDYITCTPVPIAFEQLTETLRKIGQETCEQYKNLYRVPMLDVRVPLVLTGPYRHPTDMQTGSATSLLIWETANNFEPKWTRVRATWAVEAKLTSLIVAIMGLPEMEYLLNSGPLSVAQTLDAVHSLVAKTSTYVSSESNILLVGSGEEFSLLKGQIMELPNRALIFG